MVVTAARGLATGRLAPKAARKRVVSTNAGKGFGKKKAAKVVAEEEAAPKSSPSASGRGGGASPPPPPPRGNFGESSWASEVQRSQEASGSGEAEAPAPPPKVPKMPAQDYKKLDENFITVLAFFFVTIFAEGLLVAGAGFLPEAADNFIVKFVFPAFSPTLGLFLLVSVAYGLFKSKVEPE